MIEEGKKKLRREKHLNLCDTSTQNQEKGQQKEGRQLLLNWCRQKRQNSCYA